MKTSRTLEFQMVDVKEEFTDIAVALNAMFASIDSVRGALLFMLAMYRI